MLPTTVICEAARLPHSNTNPCHMGAVSSIPKHWLLLSEYQKLTPSPVTSNCKVVHLKFSLLKRSFKLKFNTVQPSKPKEVYIKKQKRVLFRLYQQVFPAIRKNWASQCFSGVVSWEYLLLLADEKRTGGHKVETPQEWWLLATELKPAKEKPDLRLREVLW